VIGAGGGEYARASDVLLVSDYGYGAATPGILKRLRAKGALREWPVVLDSRYRMLQYSGRDRGHANEPEVEKLWEFGSATIG